jgi:hypothetical protein
MAEPTRAGYVPRIIWTLWLQGWDRAPRVALASKDSWQRKNPGWTVRALSQDDIADYLPADVLARIFSGKKRVVVIGELIRLELLRVHGGVWADATTICAKPLDDWLPEVMPHGFFAFSRPVPSRMISSWFLAAQKDTTLFETWHSAALSYWDAENDDYYFWMHEQFQQAYLNDEYMRELWDETPTMSAQHAFHFWPDDKGLKRKATPSFEAVLANPPSPVFKLTHKFTSEPKANSVFERLLYYAHGREPQVVADGSPKRTNGLRSRIRRLRSPLAPSGDSK